MQRVFETMQKVAETDLTVLIRGESGTGKELVAQALHNRSSRKNRPFVAVNCAAISRELVESELFGHEAPETQAKVLRVLQERSFERVGGTKPIEVDVRVVAATHRKLAEDVKRERFREDLYYRLKVVEIELPPLHERREDIPALAQRFLEQVTERLGLEKKRLGESALARLARHSWPGNARELENAIEQAAVLGSGATIEEADLNLGEEEAAASAGLGELEELAFADAKKRAVEKFERAYLLKALRRSGGNISRAAESIGMVRQSLQQKIRDLGLRSEDWDDRE
jgi:DNA-binding NtrC family response regulator